MTVIMEESAREQAARYLPELIGKVLESYKRFLMQEGEEQDDGTEKGKESRTRDKKFSDYHNAGKVALGHIEALFKVAKSLGVDTVDSERQLLEFVTQVSGEVKGFRKAESEDCNENGS